MWIPTIAWLLLGILDFIQARPTANPLLDSQQLSGGASRHLRPVLEKRQQFAQGQPINAQGKGAPIAGRIQSHSFKQSSIN